MAEWFVSSHMYLEGDMLFPVMQFREAEGVQLRRVSKDLMCQLF